MSASSPSFYVVAGSVGFVLLLSVIFSVVSRKHGIAAVEKWAAAKGLHVVRVRRRAFVPHWRWLSSKRFQFFRVTLRHTDGGSYKAWLRTEADCTYPEVVDVIWDDKEPSS